MIAKWTGRIVSFDGEGWEDVAEGTARYVGTPGMSAIGSAMAAGLDVRFGHAIESPESLLRDFDHVIAATPPVSHDPRLDETVLDRDGGLRTTRRGAI